MSNANSLTVPRSCLAQQTQPRKAESFVLTIAGASMGLCLWLRVK